MSIIASIKSFVQPQAPDIVVAEAPPVQAAQASQAAQAAAAVTTPSAATAATQAEPVAEPTLLNNVMSRVANAQNSSVIGYQLLGQTVSTLGERLSGIGQLAQGYWQLLRGGTPTAAG